MTLLVRHFFSLFYQLHATVQRLVLLDTCCQSWLSLRLTLFYEAFAQCALFRFCTLSLGSCRRTAGSR